MKSILFLLMSLGCIIAGCASEVRFYVCPYELAAQVKPTTDMGQKKEALAYQDYRVLVVQRGNQGLISPVQHFRPEHTFGNSVHPRVVTYEKPLTLTALIIVDEINNSTGIAVKKLSDTNWRIYWLQDMDIKDLKKEGIVYLPPYEDLPLLKN